MSGILPKDYERSSPTVTYKGLMCRMNWHTILIGLLLFPAVMCCLAAAEQTEFSSPGIGFIEIRSDREGGRVYFDTLYMGHIQNGRLKVPVDTTVSPQWKTVRMEYTSYRDFRGPFTRTEPGKTIAYQIDMSTTSYEGTGIVTFISNPPGAEIFLNGESLGVSPDSGTLVLYTVPRGLYSVEARKGGYSSITDELYVDGNAVTTYGVNLVPSPYGSLQISSNPDSGVIYLNNRCVGIAPFIIEEIPEGTHTIVVQKDGYQDFEAEVSVQAGSMGVIDAVLVSGQEEGIACTPENST